MPLRWRCPIAAPHRPVLQGTEAHVCPHRTRVPGRRVPLPGCACGRGRPARLHCRLRLWPARCWSRSGALFSLAAMITCAHPGPAHRPPWRLQADCEEGQELCDALGVDVLPSLQFWRRGEKLWEHRGVVRLQEDLGEGRQWGSLQSAPALLPRARGVLTLCLLPSHLPACSPSTPVLPPAPPTQSTPRRRAVLRRHSGRQPQGLHLRHRAGQRGRPVGLHHLPARQCAHRGERQPAEVRVTGPGLRGEAHTGTAAVPAHSRRLSLCPPPSPLRPLPPARRRACTSSLRFWRWPPTLLGMPHLGACWATTSPSC